MAENKMLPIDYSDEGKNKLYAIDIVFSILNRNSFYNLIGIGMKIVFVIVFFMIIRTKNVKTVELKNEHYNFRRSKKDVSSIDESMRKAKICMYLCKPG